MCMCHVQENCRIGGHGMSCTYSVDRKCHFRPCVLLAITTTEFISALVVTNACLYYLLSLTCSLQAEAKDIVEPVAEVKHVVTALKVRENISVHHREWFATAEQICDSVGVEPSLPRLCACQKKRSNIPAENACEYYRRVISIPLLDHLPQSLNHASINTSN